MPGIFLTQPLSKTAANGASWAHMDAYFPSTQVFANIMLSSYRTQTPERFTSFQPSWAEAYIVTPETPMTTIGFGVSFPTRRDNTVFLSTDHLTFWLQVSNNSSNNPPTSASAVGVIYDYGPARSSDVFRPVKEMNLAVHAEDGVVIGTHRSVQFDGGPNFDEDETRERLLTEAHAVSGLERDSLQVASFRAEDLPDTSDFRVDPSTGRLKPIDSQYSDRHPFRASAAGS